MTKYRQGPLMRAGFIGVMLAVLAITIGLGPTQLLNVATGIRYQAVFSEAGGLTAGNDVKVAGVKVGSVDKVSLRHGKALAQFTISSSIQLGSETTARIRTGTLLGARIMTLESAGPGHLKMLDVIPVTRTSSPYSLTEAVGDLTTNVAATNTASLNEALDTLTTTLNQISPQLGPTFDGLTRLSRSLNSRNETIGQLLRHTSEVTGILATQSRHVDSLILNANDLLEVLVQRRQTIVHLLNATSALAQQLSGLIAENEKELAPMLDKLNSVTAVLEKNRDNIAKAMPGLAKFQNALGELVSSGPYYTAFIPNIDLPAVLQPFFDYLFGFRRGPNRGDLPNSGPRAGLPDSGPRAEIPFPRNAIPQHR
jgi:phospholipid/cholesterol/gamma-HCH transport system substrate-binding protein